MRYVVEENDNVIPCLPSDTNTVLGRVLVGNSPDVGPDERAFFDEVMRAKTATAQWLPLAEMVPTTTAPVAAAQTAAASNGAATSSATN